MKKNIFLSFFVFFTILSIPAAVEASASMRMRVNGVVWDVPQVMVDNRSLVGVRFVAEALGAAVKWDEESKTVIIGSGIPTPNNTDDIQILVNGERLAPDVAPRIVNDRIMVPVRVVAEALNSRVEWDQSLNTIIITDLKYTTEHITIIPAGGVKQSDIDAFKDYAEKACFKASADLDPLQDKFYDIYVYPDHDSFVNGYLEMSECTRAVLDKRDITAITPNRLGVNIAKYFGPDADNQLLARLSWLNAKGIGGDRDTGNKAPEWLFTGLAMHAYYSERFNSLETMRNFGTSRKNALDYFGKGAIPTFSGVLDPAKLDYQYNYANYVAAKILIERIGFAGIKEMLKELDKESDLPQVFTGIAGCSLEEFDYTVRNVLQAELARETEPVAIKVKITEEGYLPDTYLTIGTAFTGEEKVYIFEVEAPGEYIFVIKPDGEVTASSGILLDVSAFKSDEDTPYDAFVAIDFPGRDFVEENMVLRFNRGLLYPLSKWLVKEKNSESESFSSKIDQPFPDGNSITMVPGNKAKLVPGGAVAFQ